MVPPCFDQSKVLSVQIDPHWCFNGHARGNSLCFVSRLTGDLQCVHPEEDLQPLIFPLLRSPRLLLLLLAIVHLR